MSNCYSSADQQVRSCEVLKSMAFWHSSFGITLDFAKPRPINLQDVIRDL